MKIGVYECSDMDNIKEAIVKFTRYKQSLSDKYQSVGSCITHDENRNLKGFKSNVIEACKKTFLKDHEQHAELCLTKSVKEIVAPISKSACPIETKTIEFWTTSLEMYSRTMNEETSEANKKLLPKCVELRNELIGLCKNRFNLT